jgi:signal transduction histidine kinase
MAIWMALDSRRRTFVAATAVVALASVAYALILRNLYFGPHAVTAIDDIGEAVAAAIASATCAWAASRAGGKDRLGWALMSISAGLWGAGEVVWSIYEVGLGVATPYPSLADAGFLSAVPFAFAGIRSFWSDARGTSSRWRVWFDGVIVALALTSTAWAFGLRTVWESPSTTKALDLAYPVSDILIGTVLILAIRRATQQQKGRMAFLLAGVAAYSIADSAFAFLTAQGAFGAVGNVIDTGWFAGYLLIALAAIYPAAPARLATKQAPLDLWQLALPWMTLLLASAGDVYSALSGHELDLFMSSVTATLAVLLTVNMIIERREFLSMLTAIEESRTTLNQEFKTALAGIQRSSKLIEDAGRLDPDEVRRLASDINRTADRLDGMIEGMLATDDDEPRVEVAPEVLAAEGAVVVARGTY